MTWPRPSSPRLTPASDRAPSSHSPPMTLSESFSLLLTRIQPLPAETEAAEQHLGTIKTRLQTVFDLVDCKRTGSYARSPSIRDFSDTDLFPVSRFDNFTRADTLINSDTALGNIRQALVDRDRKSTRLNS